MAKTKKSAGESKRAVKPAKVVSKPVARSAELKTRLLEEGVKVRFNAIHMIIVAVVALLALFGGVYAFSQGRTLSKVSGQIEGLGQKTTESENRAKELSERIEKVEVGLAEQREKTAPEALEAQFVEYYERIDKKTNTLIGVVVAAAVLVFTVIVLGGVFLVFRSYKDIERKLDGARKAATKKP